MGAILRVAAARGVPVIEDAAQAIGASRDGRRVGEGSLAATLSFFPSKNLGAMGDGGMVLTDDAAFAARVRLLRNHGQEPKYVCQTLGGNFRLDELQAAVLRAKLPYLDGWTRRRQEHAATYRALVARSAIPADRFHLPAEAPAVRHVYNQLVVRTPERDGLRDWLTARGISTAVYYPVPLHLQPAFADLGHKEGSFPEAERAARETLALPLYPELTHDSIATVVEAVEAYFAGARAPR
jgi:dTDP-4-amino-4,6-dideoxygalactose transaminase